jgi:hypothetical protein
MEQATTGAMVMAVMNTMTTVIVDAVIEERWLLGWLYGCDVAETYWRH